MNNENKKRIKWVKGLLASVAGIVLIISIAAGWLVAYAKVSIPGWIAGSKDTTPHYDVVYKTVGERALHIDIYPPRRKLFTKSPVVFYYHGGSWESGSKKLKQDDVINEILDYGITIVGVEYRLTDEVTHFPAFLDDSADAIRFITANASKYNIDKNRICVFGASAGGQISLMMALDGGSYGSEESLKDTPVNIKSAVALCAPTDFLNLDVFESEEDRKLVDELLEGLFGGTPEEMPESYKAASPIYNINKAAPPIFMAHGTKDNIVPFGQAQTFYDKAMEAKMDLRFYPVKNANHKFKAADGGVTEPSAEEILKKMISFFLWELIL